MFFCGSGTRYPSFDPRTLDYQNRTEPDSKVSDILSRAARAYAFARDEYPLFRFLPPGGIGGDGFANDTVRFVSGTKGLVAVNLGLLSLHASEATSLLAFETIAGHEFAHIYQVRNNYIDRLTVSGGGKYIELHADFMSGWFISKKTGLPVSALRDVADTLFSRGDSAVGSPGHHGTKEERFAATLEGYLRGGETDSPEGAAINGIEYLKELRK